MSRKNCTRGSEGVTPCCKTEFREWQGERNREDREHNDRSESRVNLRAKSQDIVCETDASYTSRGECELLSMKRIRKRAQQSKAAIPLHSSIREEPFHLHLSPKCKKAFSKIQMFLTGGLFREQPLKWNGK